MNNKFRFSCPRSYRHHWFLPHWFVSRFLAEISQTVPTFNLSGFRRPELNNRITSEVAKFLFLMSGSREADLPRCGAFVIEISAPPSSACRRAVPSPSNRSSRRARQRLQLKVINFLAELPRRQEFNLFQTFNPPVLITESHMT